jgi:hypothetical protein
MLNRFQRTWFLFLYFPIAFYFTLFGQLQPNFRLFFAIRSNFWCVNILDILCGRPTVHPREQNNNNNIQIPKKDYLVCLWVYSAKQERKKRIKKKHTKHFALEKHTSIDEEKLHNSRATWRKENIRETKKIKIVKRAKSEEKKNKSKKFLQKHT